MSHTATCGNIVCSEDAITYEDIEAPCVSVGKQYCASCANIIKIRQENALDFNKNPLYKIFAISNATPAKTKRFWTMLHDSCKIKMPTAKEMTKVGMRRIVQPDLAQFSKDLQKVQVRISQTHKKKISTYLLAFQQMVLLPIQWNALISLKSVDSEDDLQRIMKRNILSVLTRWKLSFTSAHHPRELPMGVAIYLSELAKSSVAKTNESLRFIMKQSGCAEGVLQIATDKLVAI